MRRITLCLALLLVFLLVTQTTVSALELLDGKLRIRGRLEQYMVFLTNYPKDDEFYRDQHLAVNQSIFAVEGLFALVDNGTWKINLVPSQSLAREVAREDFERPFPPAVQKGISPGKGNIGKGWSQEVHSPSKGIRDPVYVDLPVAFDNNSAKGSISFDLQRKAGPGVEGYGTVFALQDAAGRNLMLFQVNWESEVDPKRPAFAFGGVRLLVRGRSSLEPVDVGGPGGIPRPVDQRRHHVGRFGKPVSDLH